MERYCTKEGNNDEKVKFSLQAISILKNLVCKKTSKRQDLVVCWPCRMQAENLLSALTKSCQKQNSE